MKQNAPTPKQTASEPLAKAITPTRRFSIAQMPVAGRSVVAISPKAA